jgi:hypothetical protein
MKKQFYLFTFSVLFALVSSAQTAIQIKTVPFHGPKAIKKKIGDLRRMALIQPHLTSDAIVKQRKVWETGLRFRLDKFKKFGERLNSLNQKTAAAKEETNGEARSSDVSSTTQASAKSSVTQPIWSNFLASSFGENPTGWPPDPNGDVGPRQVAVITNGSLKVFEKPSVTDRPLVTTNLNSDTPAPSDFFITLDDLFLPLRRRETMFVSDPHIRFDRLTRRWFITAIEVNVSFDNNLILLAVSDGEQLTDETSFNYFSFPSAVVQNNGPEAALLDFPTLGVDKYSVLIGGNDFFFNGFDCNGNFLFDSLYALGYIIDKKSLTRGELTGVAAVLGIIDYNKQQGGGIVTPQGVQNGDAKADQSFFAGTSLGMNGLILAAIKYNTSNRPAELSELFIPTQEWAFPRDVTALGSPMPIDALDTRLLSASISKNKLTGQASLWIAHAIGIDEKGQFVPDKFFTEKARTGSRWYEIGNIYSRPVLKQYGTLYDTKVDGRRATSYFNPAIAASGQGHAALGGTTAAYNQYLNAFVVGRYYDDPAGVLNNAVKATNASAIYAPNFFGYVGRWGDFSQTVVDPLDDQTIWTFQEYANADDSYGTRAVQLKAPPPPTPAAIGVLSNKINNQVTLTATSTNHSGFFDPGDDKGGPGYNRLKVKSTGGILVNDLQFISPTEIRFTLLTANKTAGKYLLIITNPDGQFVTVDYTLQAPSSTLTVKNKAKTETLPKFVVSSAVFPNPTKGDFTLALNAVKELGSKIVVVDESGKQVYTRPHIFNKGNNTVRLNIGSMSQGSYWVIVYSSENTIVSKNKMIKE